MNKNKKEARIVLSRYSLILILAFILSASLAYAVSWTGNNVTYLVVEDTPYTHNFTANITDPASDMSFAVDTLGQILLKNGVQISYSEISNWTYFTNSTLGLFLLNATNDTQTGNFSIPIKVSYNDGAEGITTSFQFNISAFNDAPYFLNLGGERVINSSGIELILSAADEELDLNYTFNVSFPTCTHAVSNPPTGPANCTLFNLTYYNGTAANISFYPEGSQRGEYEINFSVTDSRNASYSTIINWTVSWNDAPGFVYVCDNERTAAEDSEFTCYFNVTDLDEENNLTFSANYSWFTFNGTSSNQITILDVGTGNFSAFVNFTPTDASVGNWSINLTVTDTGAPNASSTSNSTTFGFFVGNVNDSVSISDIANITAYTSSTYQISINATDDDILVTDKSVKNETITFISNNSYVTISTQTYPSGTNRSEAIISFDPNNLGIGAHIINITVHDTGNFSITSDIFTITVVDNTAPNWTSPLTTAFNLTEDEEFYLNLSQNVTDSEDDINFTLTIINDVEDDDTYFIMTINEDTGIINITPTDVDVGVHRVEINATDGKSQSSKEFNFTVNNVNDPPAYKNLYFSPGGKNDSDGLLLWAFEHNLTTLYLLITDDDLLVPSGQSGFYQESYTLNLTIEGNNQSLFSFTYEGILTPGANQSRWISSDFTPQQSDVGSYNVSINVTDLEGSSLLVLFNMTINETLQPPNLTAVDNAILSILGENFYVDASASDEEEGLDGPNGNLTFALTVITSGGTFLEVNSSTGIMNLTTNISHAGLWEYELTVNDTSGAETSDRFNLTIYDYPTILSPASTYNFSMKENVTSTLNFTVNHTVQDNLTFTLTIKGIEENSTSGYGNAAEFLWGYTPNFTMETTCSGAVNLTLNVSNSKLSNSTSWLVSINHTDTPLRFVQNIPSISGETPQTITLSNYFSDEDAADACLNQTIGFTYSLISGSASGGTISIAITNWTNSGISPSVAFSAASASSGNFSISAYEYNVSNSSHLLGNATSNNFSVSLTVSESTTASPSGGGGSATRIVSLKILVPNPVSAKQNDRLIIPLGLENDGDVDLEGILLEATIAKDGSLREDLVASFDQSFFEKLEAGQKERVTLIVDIDTSSTGLFEVTINATVDDPDYTDWAKLYIEIDEEKDVLEKIIFTEEFIIGNPQCAELIDLVNDAKQLFSEGNVQGALEQAEASLEACKNAITQPWRPRLSPSIRNNSFIGYTALASLLAFVTGFIYYAYKRISLNSQVKRELTALADKHSLSGGSLGKT